MAADQWVLVREIGIDLADQLTVVRGAERLKIASFALRDARLALEPIKGAEAAAARTLLAALEAAHREVGP
jgi:hypothetical protein